MLTSILEELEKREILIKAIDQIIEASYSSAPGKYLPRGMTQRHILAQLNLVRNNMLCALINERMYLKGYTPVTNHGTQSFRGITNLPNQCASPQ